MTALVTGGSSGIGLALARLLARGGMHVWLTGRREGLLQEGLSHMEGERQSSSQRFGFTAADVSDWEQVQRVVKEMDGSIGAPDLLINSAGLTHPGYFQEIPLDVFRLLMDVNYFGTLYTIRAVLPAMQKRGSGYIVNISSGAGFIGIFGYSAYSASKFAVRGFSDVIRSELKPLGIGVSIVFPPDTDTPQLANEQALKPMETKALTATGGLMSAEAVARETLRGIERGRYLILPGMESKMIYRLNGLLGNGVYTILDWLVASARRNHKKEQ